MNPFLDKVLAGRYRIVDYLGEGGMALVFKAWDVERAAYLALKLLRSDLGEDALFIRRFRREAQTLAELNHPHIVRFYGFEQDDLLAFILMDYVEGSSLRAELFRRAGRPFELREARRIIQPVLSALHYAHQQNLVHCDIKPANILMGRDGRVLLSDFGVARMSDNATTLSMATSGTPAYMAPEQIHGEAPVPATDIYALGVMLYEMLTGGERPFTGERARINGVSAEKVCWEHLHLTPESPRRYNLALSPAVEAVVLKCLAKNPRQRYASALELSQALEQADQELEQPADDLLETLQDPFPLAGRRSQAEELSQSVVPQTRIQNERGRLSKPATRLQALLRRQEGSSSSRRQPRGAWIYTLIAAMLLGIHWLVSLGKLLFTQSGRG